MSALDLGPKDYLVYPTSVHIMRYGGLNEDRRGFWRLACGSRISEATWDNGGYCPSLEEIERHGLAVCGNCARTKARP